MVKPKITEGEWRPVHIKERENEDGIIMPEGYYVSEGVNWICKLIHGRKENYPANATAISAVPKTHDQLIKYRGLLLECIGFNFESKGLEEDLDELESVMKEAGFEL